METVKFKQMAEGDAEDYALLNRLEHTYVAELPYRLLEALANLENSFAGYRVSRLEHSLQSATRAWRDGADEDWVVAALFHDIGDPLAPFSHGEYAAAILKPFVREQVAWVVEKHVDFQLYYYGAFVGANPNKRDRYLEHPFFADCAEFCSRWDQNCFDPDFRSEPLSFFTDTVHRVFTRPAHATQTIRPGERVPLVCPQ